MTRLWIRLALCGVLVFGACEAPRSGGDTLGRRARAALAEALADPALEFARFGVCVKEVGKPAPLVMHDAAMGFMTASNMKLISSATALCVLGPDWRYSTKLVGRGKQAGSVFRGDLLLIGSGDPTFGCRAFEKDGCTAPFVRMAAALREAGIKRVTGRVIGVDDVHPDEIMGRGWDWSYHADWYAAQVSGLCFNENCVDFVFDGTKVGEPPRVRLDPPTAYVQVKNLLRCTDEPGAGVDFARTLGGNLITLTGTVPVGQRGKRDWASIDNPTAFAATVLAETLVAHGIAVGGEAGDLDSMAAPAAGPEVVFHVHRSPRLAAILTSLNKRSQNLYAEQVIRTAARARGGSGSMASASRVARGVLTDLGVDVRGIDISDGSGLSRLDLVQPRQLCALLEGMYGHPLGRRWFETMPIAGVDGTLKSRFPPGNPARGRVRAKTGYISRVVALSGYIPRRTGPPLVFSILVNDYHGPTQAVKEVVDRFVGRLAAIAGAGR